jgi:mannose-6-phosphate isomerase-like protein (cupin superfamily)
MLKFNNFMAKSNFNKGQSKTSYENSAIELKDYGGKPFTINLEKATKQNTTYRTALWTGKHLQLTLMCIKVGEDVGLEMHPDVDQFFMLEEGKGQILMGNSQNNLNYKMPVYENYAFIVPAGTWHNFINTGNKSAKLFTIYAPPEHPFGTIHKTKKDAEEQEPGYHKVNKNGETQKSSYEKIKEIVKLRR